MLILISLGCGLCVASIPTIIYLGYQYDAMRAALQEVYDNLGPEAPNCGCTGCSYEITAALKAVLPFVNQHYKKKAPG